MTKDKLKVSALREARTSANAATLKAIRALTAALQHHLDGARLRGMPNLASSAAPLYAVSVRAKAGSHTRKPLNMPSGDMLVLTDRGELRMANCKTWELRLVRPGELWAEDAEKLANTIAEVIMAHCDSADRSIRRLDSIRKFGEKLIDTLEFED